MNAVKAFIPNLHFRVWLARIDFLVGLALAAWLIFTIDTRYFNIPVPTRPTWKNIINFVSGTDPDSLNLGAPHMASLMMPYVYEEIPKL